MAFVTNDLIAADVKCYFCGHVGGQIITRRNDMSGAARFIPRPGYGGPMPGQGRPLRCERCKGPVFLEDAAPTRLDAEKKQKRPISKAA